MASSQQPPDPPDSPAMLKPHRKLLIPAVEAASAAGIAVAIALVLLLLFFLYRRLVRKRSSVITASSPVLSDPAPPLRRFSYGHLRRSTSRFAPSRKLGQGGFGPVFRGSLGSDIDIAVKLMDSGSLQGDREFHNELALAAKILTSGSDADRRWVVVPFGFCCHQSKKRWWTRHLLSKDSGQQQVVDDLYTEGGEGLGKRVMLVYDLMHNGSLQDALLHKKCPELLDWGRRFSVALDIAKGIQFLHSICDPPVIHGDIKPSNILLDSRLSARIADFGLARIKASTSPKGAEEEEGVVAVEIDTKLSSKEEKKKDLALVPWGGEDDDVSVMGETVDSATTVGVEDVSGSFVNGRSPEEQDAVNSLGKAPERDDVASPSVAVDVASTSDTFDVVSIDSGRDVGDRSRLWKKGIGGGGGMFSGKEWWWRQDHGGGGNTEIGGGVKDYVMEWIKSEIKKERPKSDWITAPSVSAEDCLPRTIGKLDKKKQQRRSEWWASLDEERQNKKKNRPAREWWREEFCEELTRKQQQKKRMTSMSESGAEGGEKQPWWQKDEDSVLPTQRKKRRKKKNSWSRGASIDWWMDGHSGEMRSSGMGRRSNRDWTGGGEVPKSGGTVSSTPSMRGTVCYVAPEYGGGGPLSEKCDIYSFGVLLLVLVSGRRPLQVTASPMSEFERANLISWARHLARLGRLMELVDPTLRQVDKEQALLCITVALLCIQRSPARRPSIKEIVGMLTGQSELPHLPIEFSPSPPGGFSFKSRRKGG